MKTARISLIITIIGLIAILAMLLLHLVFKQNPATQDPLFLQQNIDIGGTFSLIDETGAPVTQDDFAGDYMLIYFGFTYCPDVCPLTLEIMSTSLTMLGENAKHIHPVFITIDPERDTPDELRLYLSYFHKRFKGLTGTPAQIADIAAAYKIYYKKVADETGAGSYVMDHSSLIYLMGPDGEFVTFFADNTPPEMIAEKINTILQQKTGY